MQFQNRGLKNCQLQSPFGFGTNKTNEIYEDEFSDLDLDLKEV